MFTRCPNCYQKQQLTVEQLRVTRAIMSCPACAIPFDALELLSETDPDGRRDAPKPTIDIPIELPWEKPPQLSSPHWRSGAMAGLVLLMVQLLYFNSGDLSQNTKLRHNAARFCRPLGCRLPAYKNADELGIVHSSLDLLPNQSHLFKALIMNQAAFDQPYPNINLKLLDYNGGPFAQQTFRPQDYLFNPQAATMAPDANVELKLNIAPTATAVGGYTFDLTY
jgi:hypothetical protein